MTKDNETRTMTQVQGTCNTAFIADTAMLDEMHAAAGVCTNVDLTNFEKTPEMPIGYWVSEMRRDLYSNKTSSDSTKPKADICTEYDEGSLKIWHEIDYNRIGNTYCSNYLETLNQDADSWYLHCEGGAYRKWYGNCDYVLDYSKEALREKDKCKGTGHDGEENPCHEGTAWPRISPNQFYARLLAEDETVDGTGTSVFPSSDIRNIMLGLLNSKMTQPANLTDPTGAICLHDITGIPFIKPNDEQTKSINSLVRDCISISKFDWDAHETSWDFQRNPLWEQQLVEILFEMQEQGIMSEDDTIEDIGPFNLPDLLQPLEILVLNYKAEMEDFFWQLHNKEEELNRQFIEIYGLQGELTPDVPLDEITLLQNGEISIE